MPNNLSVAVALLLWDPLELVLKTRDHGDEHQTSGQKFADIARTQWDIPFAVPLTPRLPPPLKVKSPDRRGRNTRDQSADSQERSGYGRGPKRHPGQVDVSV